MYASRAIPATVCAALLFGCGVADMVLQSRDAGPCDGCADAQADAGTLDFVGPPTFDPGPCTVDGWCWLLPAPQGNPLRAVWGSGPSDIYAVGDAYTITHFDGSEWQVIASGLPAGERWLDYHAVWGFSPSDVFVAGDGGAIMHFDGQAWRSHSGAWMQEASPPAIHALWGESRSALYAVGEGGTILRFDGARWTAAQSNTEESLNTIWGLSSSEIFVGGTGGTILRLQGSSWEPMFTDTEQEISALWSASSDALFAAARDGSVLRYLGTQWRTIAQANGALDAIWGRSATDVFFAGGAGLLHYDGLVLETRSGPTPLYGLWSDGSDPLVAVGNAGTVLVEAGDTFAQQAGFERAINGVWARSATEVYLVGGNELMRWDGSTLSHELLFSDGFAQKVCGRPDGTLVVMETAAVNRRDASGTWGGINTGGGVLEDIWCSPSSVHVVAVGWNGQVIRYDGTSWIIEGSGSASSLRGVWGSAPDDVYAVGDEGQVAHFDGTSWSQLQSTGLFGPLSFIAGRSATEIYIASGLGISRFDGATVVRSHSLGFTVKALGGSEQHLFAADGSGRLYRLEEGQWIAEASPAAAWIDDFSATDTGVWGVGFNGALIHKTLR